MSEQSWHMAALALKLLAIDPKGLSGAIIKMRASPDREAIISNFAANLPLRKIPLTISDDQLLGGIDLTTA
ncbi:MAG: magnesium chelatase ATPase subunit D, partial [Tateyamaria sp.]|nr:magnesium chelatase ATPase subunit D [Tateyamaria sp.]